MRIPPSSRCSGAAPLPHRCWVPSIRAPGQDSLHQLTSGLLVMPVAPGPRRPPTAGRFGSGHCETRTTPLRPLLGGPDRDQDEAARAHRAESLPRSPSSIAGPGASSASAHETDSIGAPTRSREQDLPCESHRAWRAWSHEAWRTTACADDTQAPEIAEQARLSLARKATREQRRLVPRRRRCRVGRGRQQGRHPR